MNSNHNRLSYRFPFWLTVIFLLLILVPCAILTNQIILAKLSGLLCLLIVIVALRFWFRAAKLNSNVRDRVIINRNDWFDLERLYPSLYKWSKMDVSILKDRIGLLLANVEMRRNKEELCDRKEAIELAFYGASVIHPKTLQPLQKKEIPLYVKSFINPTLAGTRISRGLDLEPKTSCFIVKKNQLLLSLSSIDFDFIMENHISEIFALFSKYKIKVNLIQNTAISFSVCIEDKYNTFEELRKVLAKKFKVSYNENVSLYTIRHFDENAAKVVETNKTVLLRQISRETMQVITKE